MPTDYNPLTKDSGTPTVPGPTPPMRDPNADAPEAPDMAQGALAGTPATSDLGGPQAGPAAPRKPSVSDRVANFISGGQQSPGSVWRGILSGALTGMVAGAAQPHPGQAALAGAQAAQAQRQQKLENEQKQSALNAENQLRNAQIAKLNHDTAAVSWDLSHRQDLALAEHANASNKLAEMAMAAPGSIDLGVVKNLDDVVQLHKDHPSLPADMSKGAIFSTPHFSPVIGADGKPTGEMKYDGQQAFYVPPEYGNQKIDHDIDIPIFKPGAKPNEPGHWENQTIKAGTYSNKDVMALQMKQTAEAAKYDNDAVIARAQKASADASLDYSKIAKNTAEAEQLKQDAKDQGLALYEGDKAPSQFQRDPKLKRAAEAEANRISLERTGQPFNETDAETRYKGTQKTVLEFTTGQEARNITAFNTAIAHLKLLDDAAKDLGNGDVTKLNQLANEMARQTGKPVPATYDAVHAAVTGEVGSVYKKGSPDVGLEEKLDKTFKDSQSPAAAHAALTATTELMLGKVDALYNQFTNGTRGKAPEKFDIHLISPESEAAIKSFGLAIPGKFVSGAQPGPPQAPAGMVAVQIPGQPIGFIPKEKVDEFKAANKDNGAKVY